MSEIIEDQRRFKNIIRGRIRDNLRKYLSGQDVIISKDGKKISIPMPRIETPRFRFEDRDVGGVGQGDGEEGDTLSQEEGDDDGKAGDQEGSHAQEIEFTMEEFVKIIAEELKFPKLEPKGRYKLVQEKVRWSGIKRQGPRGLRVIRRTLRNALKRAIISGTFDTKHPVIIPEKDDFRYRAPNPIIEKQAQAVIIYMMDVSGSMGEEQKMIARIEAFWISEWVKLCFKGIEERFIIHDAVAQEVDKETFFTTRESGGTKISSAYTLCAEMVEKDYPTSEWNIFPFHFSDGDNWGVDDNEECLRLLEEILLPASHTFFYSQVTSPYGSGEFKSLIEGHFFWGSETDLWEKIRTTKIDSRDNIKDGLVELLGK
ncbi:MAG: DUF444 family protein [Patescibacteria group bacterium]|nr:DUF444 family protein [Patescibacteria group bacterium]